MEEIEILQMYDNIRDILFDVLQTPENNRTTNPVFLVGKHISRPRFDEFIRYLDEVDFWKRETNIIPHTLE